MARYVDHLRTTVYGAQPGQAYRFWFSAHHSPWMSVEPLTASGRAKYDKVLQAVGDAGHRGALIVDPRGRMVVVSANPSRAVLQELATLVADRGDRLPSLLRFHDAGLARAVDLDDDAALAALPATRLKVRRDASMWAAPTAGPARVAAEVGALEPGQRAWFWLPDDPSVDPVFQQVDADPLMAMFGRLVAHADDGHGAACSGTGVVTTRGVLQLLSTDATEAHLAVLAAWVRDHVAAHPDLARLRDAELVRVPGGVVEDVFADPALWDGVPRVPCPGTLEAAAAALSGLAPGQAAWFFMTAHGDDGAPFVTLGPMEGDDAKSALNKPLRALAQRFPDASDRVHGVARRLPSGRVLLATQRADVDHWPALVADLARRHPALADLAGARLLQLTDGNPSRALAVPETT